MEQNRTPRQGGRGRRRLLWCLGIGAAALLLAAALRRVPDDTAAILVSAVRADRVVDPGWQVVLPLAEDLHRLDAHRYASTVAFFTPEGSRLDAEVTATLRLSATGARRLLERAPPEAHGGLASLDGGIDVVLADVLGLAAREGLPDLAGRVRQEAVLVLSAYGAADDLHMRYAPTSTAGLKVQAAQIRDEIRARSRDTGVKILIVGLDGADWQIAGPLMDAGRMPHLRDLRRRGAWGDVRTLKPPLSPLLWTSVATGTTADRHGIVDFLVRDPDSGAQTPVSSRFRRAPAFWNLMTDAGRQVDVVAWWATWPAEPVNGHMVSDRLSYSLFDFGMPSAGAGTTYPPEYFDEVRPRLVGHDDIAYEEIARFADVTRAEYEAARALIRDDRRAAFRHPLNHLAKILAATRNYHRLTLDLLRQGQADLTAVYYQMIDEVCHRFIHFAPPRLEGIDPGDVRRYGRVVERAYAYQDRLLGEIVGAASTGTVVIVVSDHGFLNGPDRPRGMTADIEGQPGRWHRSFGILTLAGPPVSSGRIPTASLLDILPTVMSLSGMPAAEDGGGRVLSEAIRPDFVRRFPPSAVRTYRAGPYRPETLPVTTAMAESDAAIVETLRSLGYIGGGTQPPQSGPAAAREPDRPGAGDERVALDTVTAHTNVGSVHLAAGNLAEAEAAILAALRMSPSYRPAQQQLFELRARQKRYDEAIRAAEEILAQDESTGPLFLTHVAQVYRAAGKTEEGTARFARDYAAGRWACGVPLSRLMLESGDVDGAFRVAHEVLARDPMNEPAMAVLYRAAQARGRLAEVEPQVDAALRTNGRSVMYLNWKAILVEGRGGAAEAEGLLKQALDANPDHGGSMANLGAFYTRHARPADAVPLLERALRIDPGNLEGRVNLASALAMMGRMDEAIHHYEEAVRKGLENTSVYNALARAHGEKGDFEASRDWLRRSLELDPGQPHIKELLQQVERRS